MLSGVGLQESILPNSNTHQSRGSTLNIDQFRIFLAAHRETLPLGWMREREFRGLAEGGSRDENVNPTWHLSGFGPTQWLLGSLRK